MQLGVDPLLQSATSSPTASLIPRPIMTETLHSYLFSLWLCTMNSLVTTAHEVMYYEQFGDYCP